MTTVSTTLERTLKMRQVSKAMIECVQSGWTRSVSANTRVECDHEKYPGRYVARVLLHDNVIFCATFTPKGEYERGYFAPTPFPYDGQYKFTPTTKERIRSLCSGLNIEKPEGY